MMKNRSRQIKNIHIMITILNWQIKKSKLKTYHL
jgi:hypothetical protein